MRWEPGAPRGPVMRAPAPMLARRDGGGTGAAPRPLNGLGAPVIPPRMASMALSPAGHCHHVVLGLPQDGRDRPGGTGRPYNQPRPLSQSRAQGLVLGLGRDALSGHVRVHRVGHGNDGDDGANHAGVARVAVDGVYKAAVHLDCVEGQPVQQAERGVAVAEVIQMPRDVDLGQGAKDLQRMSGVSGEGRFGQLPTDSWLAMPSRLARLA